MYYQHWAAKSRARSSYRLGGYCLKPSPTPHVDILLVKDARDTDEQENANVLDTRPESSITNAP